MASSRGFSGEEKSESDIFNREFIFIEDHKGREEDILPLIARMNAD
jgi:hypothetical protein